MTTMREYYDKAHGAGAWDRMHDLISHGELSHWKQPDIEVDGRTVSIFPGTNREVTLEQVQTEIRKIFAQRPQYVDRRNL